MHRLILSHPRPKVFVRFGSHIATMAKEYQSNENNLLLADCGTRRLAIDLFMQVAPSHHVSITLTCYTTLLQTSPLVSSHHMSATFLQAMFLEDQPLAFGPPLSSYLIVAGGPASFCQHRPTGGVVGDHALRARCLSMDERHFRCYYFDWDVGSFHCQWYASDGSSAPFR
jgi:hypothetical protein